MNGCKQTYDLICSLGGNCAAANNLERRGLRDFAYPFDWTYFTSDEAVYKLADGFKHNFKDYLNKDNLKELPLNPSHPEHVQYEDGYGKIIWANHFNDKIENEKEYFEVKKKLDRRFKRLINNVEQSKKILFIFSIRFQINIDSFEYLLNELNKMYPDKEFNIKVISFNCEKDEHINAGTVDIYRYTRDMNDYDYLKTNYEWHFLDNIKLSKKRKNKILFRIFRCDFIVDWSKK